MDRDHLRNLIVDSVGKLVRAKLVSDVEPMLLEVDGFNSDHNEVVAFWVDQLTLERHCPPAWNGVSPPWGIPSEDFESIEFVTIDRDQSVADLVAALRSWNWFANVGQPIDFGEYARLQHWNDWTEVESFPQKIMEMEILERRLPISQLVLDTFDASEYETLLAPGHLGITDLKTEETVRTHCEMVCRLVVKSVRLGVPINKVVRNDWEWLRHGHWPCGRFDNIF